MSVLRPVAGRLLRPGVLAIVLAAGSSGCWTERRADVAPATEPTTTTTVGRPCSEPVARASLGQPDPDDLRRAENTTDGSPQYYTATGYSPGAVPFVDKNLTGVSVGDVAHPAEVREGDITNATHRVDLREDEPTMHQLPAGRYWLSNSRAVQIIVESCTPGGFTDATPADEQTYRSAPTR